MTSSNKITISLAFKAVTLFIILLIAASGCSERPDEKAAEYEIVNESFLAALPNVELTADATSTGVAKLKDGYFEESATPSSATKTIIRLGQKSIGDLNADGTADAGVIVIVDSGGSGTFYHLGVTKHIGSVFLGDRISIQSLGISKGVVTVTYLERNSTESMTAKPTAEKSRTFSVHNGSIDEAS